MCMVPYSSISKKQGKERSSRQFQSKVNAKSGKVNVGLGVGNVKERYNQGQGRVKAMSREGQSKVKARSKQGQGEVKARSR